MLPLVVHQNAHFCIDAARGGARRCDTLSYAYACLLLPCWSHYFARRAHPVLAMLQAVRATARRRTSVADAKAAAHRRAEEEYDALAARLEQHVGDVGQAVLPRLVRCQ